MVNTNNYYSVENLVLFKINKVEKVGVIYDIHYFDNSDLRLFDIFVEEENTIYKCVKGEEITGRLLD